MDLTETQMEEKKIYKDQSVFSSSNLGGLLRVSTKSVPIAIPTEKTCLSYIF